jgi:hypothetical protein
MQLQSQPIKQVDILPEPSSRHDKVYVSDQAEDEIAEERQR